MIHSEIISKFENLIKIKDEWNRVYSISSSGNFFLSWQLVTTWWKHFGNNNKLHVLLVKDSDEIVGIAPLMIFEEKRKMITMKCLSFIGQSGAELCPDHIDIITKPGYEKEVANCVINSILTNGGWDKISFSDISGDSVFYNELTTILDRQKIRYYSGISNISPYAKLPTNKNEKKWKYYHRRLADKADIRFEHYSTKDDLITALNIVKNLLLKSAERNNRGSNWSDDNYYMFHKDLSESISGVNIISIAVLYCDNTPVSVLYGFIDKKKFMLYSTGFDSDYASFSVGQILIWLFCNYLVEQGLAFEFDFLRGDEDYKHRWTDVDRKDKFVYFYGNNPKGVLIKLTEMAYRKYQKFGNHEK